MIDTDVPFRSAARIWRSLAFRWRFGPAVQAINLHVCRELPPADYELIWVDKGVCLQPATVKLLRRRTRRLVYYTPDTSFLHNRSRFFDRTVSLYDLVATTKTLEFERFVGLIGADRLLLTTQSYDSQLHYPCVTFAEKRPEAVFVGLCEPDREVCVQALLQVGVPVRLGGVGWDLFLKRNQKNSLLFFEGRAVFGEHYARVLSQASVGLGLLTKRPRQRQLAFSCPTRLCFFQIIRHWGSRSCRCCRIPWPCSGCPLPVGLLLHKGAMTMTRLCGKFWTAANCCSTCLNDGGY